MMDKLSIQILCLIFLIDVVHSSSCYYVHQPEFPTDFYYTYYESCLAGCCGSSTPGDLKTCCDPIGLFVGISFGILGFVIVCLVLKVCFRRNASNNSYSHNEREVLIPPPRTYSPATGYSNPSPRIEYSYPPNHTVQTNTS